jgi:hypothetical protein
MKTLKTVLKERPEYKTLINAVINNVGMESVEDITNHGIDGGYSGFIYTADTVAFYKKHKKDILKMAQEMAESLGEDMLAMIASFGCLNGRHKGADAEYTPTEIGEAIFSGRGKYADQLLNAMAWFAAEEVCRMFED